MTDARTTTGFAALSDEELRERLMHVQQTVLELETELRRLVGEDFGEPTSQYLTCAQILEAMLLLLNRFDKEIDSREAARRREARREVAPALMPGRWRGW
jgi:hypothetical protein